MNYKKTTLIAAIGCIILIIPVACYTLINFGLLQDFINSIGTSVFYGVMNLIHIIGFVCLFLFFITLYSSQKK